MEEVILPLRVAKFLGCHTAVLTNAAGGINHDFHLGDLMLITGKTMGDASLQGAGDAWGQLSRQLGTGSRGDCTMGWVSRGSTHAYCGGSDYVVVPGSHY
jgi:hypothetical protein